LPLPQRSTGQSIDKKNHLDSVLPIICEGVNVLCNGHVKSDIHPCLVLISLLQKQMQRSDAAEKKK
jgi:hypothetical protein